jgi:hypothetical protein
LFQLAVLGGKVLFLGGQAGVVRLQTRRAWYLGDPPAACNALAAALCKMNALSCSRLYESLGWKNKFCRRLPKPRFKGE